MSDVSKTSSTMKNQIKSQETEISKLRGRLNLLVDNIAVLENLCKIIENVFVLIRPTYTQFVFSKFFANVF